MKTTGKEPGGTKQGLQLETSGKVPDFTKSKKIVKKWTFRTSPR
jgi:hypothetical protein